MKHQKKNSMREQAKTEAIIPTLLAGAAVYFGLSKNSGTLADLAKEAVSRMINDQTSRQKEAKADKPVLSITQQPGLPPPRQSRHRNRHRNKARKFVSVAANENKNNQV